MPIIYRQTDTANTCDTDGYGSSAVYRKMLEGGTAGSSAVTLNVGSGQSPHTISFNCIPGAGVTWSSGTLVVRINLTTAEKNASIQQIRVRRGNSSCAHQEDLATTSPGTLLDTTGVKTINVTISQATSPASTDNLVVYVQCTSSSHSASIGITPSENIDTPFTAAAFDADKVPRNEPVFELPALTTPHFRMQDLQSRLWVSEPILPAFVDQRIVVGDMDDQE